MKRKDFLIDYTVYILLKLFGPMVRFLPKGLSYWIGRRLGEIFFIFDLRHRAIAYANIKTALGGSAPVKKITVQFYRSFAQNIIDIFFIPRIDKAYLEKFVVIEGYEHIEQAFKRGKGVIFVAMHAGSWELSNIICARLGFAFSMFVREQKFPRVARLLTRYRSAQGCRFIQRENELRDLIRVLKANEAVAMTIDQGGRSGTGVSFFGKDASMASGAVRLALKLGSALVPVFPSRDCGSHIRFHVEPAFTCTATVDFERDVVDNLQRLVHIFEGFLRRYPQEYLWSYRIWKYSAERRILILSDGKTGHLRQSQALANIVSGVLRQKNIRTDIQTIDVAFKNSWQRLGLVLSGCLSGKYICQGCLRCLRRFLDRALFRDLAAAKPDIIISCGSSLAPINYLLSKENQARSMVIMRPGLFSTRRFDLVVMAKHDNPPQRKNIAVIDGALNLIDREYLEKQAQELSRTLKVSVAPQELAIGLLLGGDTKHFSLTAQVVGTVLQQLKDASEKINAHILATTSRRTSPQAQEAVKTYVRDSLRTKLLVIANEKNYPFAVGGIIGLSALVVLSPESISMISEALNARKYVVVFEATGLSRRHRSFLENLRARTLIYLVSPEKLCETIEHIIATRPAVASLQDNDIVAQAVRKVL